MPSADAAEATDHQGPDLKIPLVRTGDHVSLRRPNPSHQQADASSILLAAGEDACETPAIENRDAVAERLDLIEIGRDEHDRSAALACLAQRVVDEGGRADVEPGGRVDDDEQLRMEAQYPREHELLLVAAAEVARRSVGTCPADVERRDRARGKAAKLPEVDEPGKLGPLLAV